MLIVVAFTNIDQSVETTQMSIKSRLDEQIQFVCKSIASVSSLYCDKW